MVISSRKEAMYWIGLHMVPNIVGVARFTYGFHRTAADVGRVLDICLDAESFANICSDIAVIRLLRKAARMTRVLGAFVTWNTVALLLCCGGNLAGLRFPPKWYTNLDADELSFQERTKIAAIGAPIIILAALGKLYYTSMLYDFYSSYKTTTITMHEEALVESGPGAKVEVRRASKNRPINDVSSPLPETAVDTKVMKTSKKSQARGGRLLPQSADAEDRLTTIIPQGKPRRLSDRSRRQSTATDFHTGASSAAKSKPPSGKTRRQSTASEFARTIDDAAATIGRPVHGRGRRQSYAPRGAVTSAHPAKDRRQSAASSDMSTIPDVAMSQKPPKRPQTGASGTAMRPCLAGVSKSGQQSTGSAFSDAKLFAKILSRRQTTSGAGSSGFGGTSVPRRSSSSSSSATVGSGHPASDVPQSRVRTPRQSVGGANACGISATSPVRKSSGQLPQEPLPTDEAGVTAKGSDACSADRAPDSAG